MIYNNTEVTLVQHSYENNGNLAVLMMSEDGSVYTIVSKNIDALDPPRFAVDENNNPGISKWLKQNGIAKDTRYTFQSGFVTYPIYELLVELPSLDDYRMNI